MGVIKDVIMKARCRHCHRPKVNRPLGLCWSCYYKPGIRKLYPSTSKFAQRGVGNVTGSAPLPDSPTQALPGSKEKVQVMRARAMSNQALWHPGDAKHECV